MNPNNYKQVFVSDIDNKVWGSSDEGATWSNMTLNLPSLTSLVTTIEVFSPDATRSQTRWPIDLDPGGLFFRA
jgi:hypothetical protein